MGRSANHLLNSNLKIQNSTMKHPFTTLLILSVLLFMLRLAPAAGQEKTGNIVEYVGKEKIDEVREGKLVQVFDEGLVLPLVILDDRSTSFPLNPVFKKFLTHPDQRATENEVFDVDYLGHEMKWQTIQTDSSHTFNDRILRSGYLYLEYDS